MKPWRKVTDRSLHRWAGAEVLERGRAIAAACRVRGLVGESEGDEGRATVMSLAGGAEPVTVQVTRVLESEGARATFRSECACGRSPCEHAVALVIALRTRWKARAAQAQVRQRKRAAANRARRCEGAKGGERCGTFGLEPWEIPGEEATWLRRDGADPARQEGGGAERVDSSGRDEEDDQDDRNPY